MERYVLKWVKVYSQIIWNCEHHPTISLIQCELHVSRFWIQSSIADWTIVFQAYP